MRKLVRTWITRFSLFLVSGVLLAVVGQFFIQVAQDKGWYKDAGKTWDAVVLNVFQAMTTPTIFYVAAVMICVATGMWIDTALSNFDARRARKEWFLRHKSFSIMQFSCLAAGITQSDFDKSSSARGFADEIKGYVDSGEMPIFLERKVDTPFSAASRGEVYNGPPYAPKNVSFDAVIGKEQLEKLARTRKWFLPWDLPPPEPKTETPQISRYYGVSDTIRRLLEAGKGLNGGKYD